MGHRVLPLSPKNWDVPTRNERKEKEKRDNFVASQKRALQDLSSQKSQSKHDLIKSFTRFMRDLVVSRFAINYVLPAMFISTAVITYWSIEIRFYHLPIPFGIAVIIILLTKSRIFSRKYLRPMT